MSGSDWVRDWAKARKADLQPSFEMMEAGKLRTHETRDGASVDTTAASKAVFRDMIADLDRIIEGGRPVRAGVGRR